MSDIKKWMAAVAGTSAAAIAVKFAYEKAKEERLALKEEEEESSHDVIQKYNAFLQSRVITPYNSRIDEFEGCDVTAVCAEVVIDLRGCKISRDIYVSLKLRHSSVQILLPKDLGIELQGRNKLSRINNAADEEGQNKLYLICDVLMSRVDIVREHQSSVR